MDKVDEMDEMDGTDEMDEEWPSYRRLCHTTIRTQPGAAAVHAYC